ncbi:pre-mRNA-splicing factor CWC22 homolog [Abrus precatorius]|uniref:Pre-mRNA-splicing factor CWC22 homolog n=1 Tax=Abrus precatorius TaxID=3816 RepID=A0A8B8KM99_ABRPR|nr:pre-mRNA-splicing factor CWC22 homolog [Abrus precatorius]
MGKSSSSLKKKRSKNSSKAKASSRRKSRKYKSKKVRRREVSLSSSDYDVSKSLDPLVSSSSGDSYRRKRDRSRGRKDVKGRKKRARRSYSRDSSEDSHYARKRKKAKRKNEYDEVREKPYKKKKIRKEASVSSMSNRSWSCSTCQKESASSDNAQYESHRGRSEKKEKHQRRLKGRSGSDKSSRYKARSCSSCSPSSESSYEGTEEKHVGENNSRWLRSVITVAKEAEESEELCRNEVKEEIVDDHDYPCRSNDSNDGGTKRELDHHMLLASEENLRVDDEMGDMNSGLNFTDPELGDRNHDHRSNLEVYSAGTSEAIKKETGETSGADQNGDDDLESILRQRALENLRKFQGERPSTRKASDQKNKIVNQVKQSITDKPEPVQGKSIVNDVGVGTKFNKPTPVEETNLPVGRRNLIAHPRNNERSLNIDKNISGSAKHRLSCAPDNTSGTDTKSSNHSTSNLELTTQTQNSCHDSLQTAASNELPNNAKLPVTKGDLERNPAKTTQTAIRSVNNNGRDVDELRNSATPESCFEGSSLENKSGKLQEESNQGSQFEQKTMNVMRGGEMVQVSYKVYIPNKVPALARRQLKR